MITHYCDLGKLTAQKMKFFIKDFFSKCDQIRSFLKTSFLCVQRLFYGTPVIEDN